MLLYWLNSFCLYLNKVIRFWRCSKYWFWKCWRYKCFENWQEKTGFLSFVFDILKGFVPLIVLKNYLFTNSSELIVCAIASLTILGHIFPIWLKFKGGKGVATYIGYIFAINYIFGLIFIFAWLFIALIIKYSSLASIVSLIILPLSLYVMQFNKDINLLLLFISIIILIKHYSNILRLFNKIESKKSSFWRKKSKLTWEEDIKK